MLRCIWTQTSYRRWKDGGAVLQCQAKCTWREIARGRQQCGERRRTKKAYLGLDRPFTASATTALRGDRVCDWAYVTGSAPSMGIRLWAAAMAVSVGGCSEGVWRGCGSPGGDAVESEGGQGWLFAEESWLHHGAKSMVSVGLSSTGGRTAGWVVVVWKWIRGDVSWRGAELVVAELCLPA